MLPMIRKQNVQQVANGIAYMGAVIASMDNTLPEILPLAPAAQPADMARAALKMRNAPGLVLPGIIVRAAA
jgi:hypothetical protein